MLCQNFLLSCLIIVLVHISYINYAFCSEYCTIHKMVAEAYYMKQEQAMFLSPAEDESSREVFGLIKKLNVVPDTKKKAKIPCKIFSMLLYYTHQRKRKVLQYISYNL